MQETQACEASFACHFCVAQAGRVGVGGGMGGRY